jgi:cell wall-associated NlpC family hydrolase
MDGYLGWTYKPYLTEAALPEPTHIVLAPAVELRAAPEANSQALSRLFGGTQVKIETVQGNWAKVLANVTGWVPLADLRALDSLPQTEADRRQQMVIDAQRLIGVPYLWGGSTGNGIDCSGFARLLHRWVGVELPRDADMQSVQSTRVEPPLQPGDLFFFGEDDSERRITHVGVSLGGWKVLHSSRSRNGVYLDDVQEKEGLRSIFVHAGTFLRK